MGRASEDTTSGRPVICPPWTPQVHVAAQTEAASMFAKLTTSLIAHRVRRLLPLMVGWPRWQVLLLSGDVSVSGWAMAKLRRDYSNFLRLKEVPGAACRRMQKRSIFNMTTVVQLVKVCEGEGWAVTDRLRQFVSRSARRITVTQLVEDGFNRERKEETRGINSVVSANRLYSGVLKTQVLGKVHRYDEIKVQKQRRARNMTITPKVLQGHSGIVECVPS